LEINKRNIQVNKLKPAVYKSISAIIGFDVRTAKDIGVQIDRIEVTKELYMKIANWLIDSDICTHYMNRVQWVFTIHFRATCNLSNPTYYWLLNGSHRKSSECEASHLMRLEKTPTLLALFYGILKKYPEHLLNVSWSYKEPSIEKSCKSESVNKSFVSSDVGSWENSMRQISNTPEGESTYLGDGLWIDSNDNYYEQ
jgi:hypothetical protein